MPILKPDGYAAVNDTFVEKPFKRPVLVACNAEQAIQIFANIGRTQYELPIVCALPPKAIWAMTEDEAVEFFDKGIQFDLPEEIGN